MTAVTRISFDADMPKRLVDARKAFNALFAAGIDMPRHEHVRKDGRVYIDAKSSEDVARAVVGAVVTAAVDYEPAETRQIDECLNCGNIADLPSAVCPNCEYRDIAPCPSCRHDVARQEYEDVHGDISRCPKCHTRVRMSLCDPMWLPNGLLNQPAVIVVQATP